MPPDRLVDQRVWKAMELADPHGRMRDLLVDDRHVDNPCSNKAGRPGCLSQTLARMDQEQPCCLRVIGKQLPVRITEADVL